MRPFGPPKTLERRRRRAISLLTKGLGLAEVASRIGATVNSVWRWKHAYSLAGDNALAPKAVPGRPRKLEDKECQKLLEILLEGALAYGFPNEFWTLKRIARVIQKEFGVKYHPSHVWKILRRFRWSCQVPERRAIQRDEEGIKHWKRYKWPAIKKKVPRTWCPPRLP
jgi:transposase